MVYLARTGAGQAQYSLTGTSGWKEVNLPGRKKSLTPACSDGQVRRSSAVATESDVPYVDMLKEQLNSPTGSRASSKPRTRCPSDAGSSPGSEEQKIPATCEDLRDVVLKHTFDAADKDGSGSLSKAEFTLLLRRAMPNIQPRLLQQMWNMADRNRDQSVTYQEFLKWIKSDAQKELASAMTEQAGSYVGAMSALFRLWDTNEDGTISEFELQTLVKKVCPQMQDEELARIFQAMDVDQNGVVDYCEFVQFLFGEE
eukprot:gb/GFBE01073044.1/.p1 GENE.gb/GFBE01073044.1/~~gb/GFBE01073044.1/.p1  ORF type:complete len:256 (+),score=64.01 gb/GFBE01073044.1/:1-768(+)